MKYLKTTITITLLVLTSFVKVFLDILQYDVQFHELSNAYWIATIRDNVLLLVVLYLASSLQKDKTKATYKVYTELRTAITTGFISLKNSNAIERFKAFIIADNRMAKLAAYKAKLNRKIARIKDAISRKENRINAKRVSKGLEPIEEPKTERLVRLRLKLEAKEGLLADAETVIEYVRVRYKKVSYDVLFGEEETKAREDRDLQFHEMLHNVFILGKKAVLVLLISAFSVLQFQNVGVNFSAYTIFRVSYSLFSLALSVYLGVTDGDKFVRGQMCDVLRRRIRYIQGFIETKQKHIEVTVVEQTQEQDQKEQTQDQEEQKKEEEPGAES